ncbi:MAG TPA: radical SAM family heme chaperone HemW [Myxococcaceae bacterium]|nr:radical SAM family heme chaperone HemW [Myxococcaceae bacterium]
MQVDPLTGLEVARSGLYVHFPYCLRRCPYCDFTIAIARSIPGTRYADAVLAELRLRVDQRPAWAERPLDSVYLGGGTPSLWEPRDVQRVLEGIATVLPLAPEAEVSLEANPEVADAARLAGYRAAGVNRLSLGIQSFEPAVLATLGRAHSPDDAEGAFGAARAAGFQNVSVDLIHGVPGQSLAGAVEDARRTVGLGPEHVSSYVLTVEREHLGAETVFSRRLRQGRLALPDDLTIVEMVDAVGEVLGGAGLERYEISSHAVPGRHSRHNALYWTGGESLALGAGAVGFHRQGSGAVRTTNLRSTPRWLQAVESGRAPEEDREALDASALYEERLLLGLRLRSGLDLAALWAEHSIAPRTVELHTLIRDGFLEQNGQRVRLTRRGAHLHQEISARLV